MNSSLRSTAKEIRKKIFKMIYKAGGGHIAPSLSIVDILTALYFGGVMNYDPKDPKMPHRDRFILSKGHASAALFSVLAEAGYIEDSVLDTYCQTGSILGGHPDMNKVPGVEASTGALGHGFLYAAGIAMAGKLDGKSYRVYALLGDGECQEGSVWEAALFSAQQKLGNLTAIIDYNKLQAMDRLGNIVEMEPLADKWKSFGWDVIEVDGHNIEALVDVLSKDLNLNAAPRVVIAHTVKGKGISFMEDTPIWHYRMPNEEEMKVVLKELDITLKELTKA